MRKLFLALAAVALLVTGCSRKTPQVAGIRFDTDVIPMGVDKTVYPTPGADGEIPDESWEDFRYLAEFHMVGTATGKRLSDVSFASLSPFLDGIAVASEEAGGELFFVRKDGSRLFDGGFRDATLFSGGVAWVRTSDDEIWAVNEKGEMLFPADGAESATVFYDGKSVVNTVDGYTKVMDTRGEVLLSVRGRGGQFVVDGLLPVADESGRQGVVGMDGGFVIEPEYYAVGLSQWSDVNDYLASIRGGRLVVSGEDGWGVIDLAGEVIIPLVYDDIVPDGDMFLAFGDDGAVWFDRDGARAIDKVFADARPFKDGPYAAAFSGGRWGHIDRQGNWKLEPRFLYAAESFDANSLAVFNDDELALAGIMDELGRTIVAPEYSYIYNISGTDRYMAGKGDFVGILDKEGRTVMTPDTYTLVGGDFSGYASVMETESGSTHMQIYIGEY